MSLQAEVLIAVAVALVLGFAWYERSRPSARIVAVVAALCALAVAGRVALAPFPNVVATTDVALISGYALGPAPGFVVGALAAPVSNIWLGQGPWTIWQMAGWGGVGLLGAALFTLMRGGIGRLGLAFACALASLMFGALQDLSVMVTYGGEQSLERLLALSSRSVPFNLAHAVGSFAIAYAAGPALIAMLRRMRARSEHTWEDPVPSSTPARPRPRAAGLAAIVAAVAVAGSLVGQALAPEPASASNPQTYLVRSQNSDGGFGASPSSASNPVMTSWAMLGLAAAGLNPLDLKRNGRTPVDYLRANAGRISSTGDIERTILALRASGVGVSDFAGRDLAGQLRSRRRGNGSFEDDVNLTAFGVLALRAAGDSAQSQSQSLAWLRRNQHDSGGWGFRPGAAPDADSTGAALQALGAGGVRHGAAADDGIDFLRRSQGGDGGWALAGGGTNSQSTAWALQGLIAQEVSPDAIHKGGRTGIDYLRARRAADGRFQYAAGRDQTPVWVTAQALVAFKGRAYPLRPTGRGRTVRGGPAPSSRGPRSGGSGPGAGPEGSGAGRRGGGGSGFGGGASGFAPGVGGGGEARAERRRGSSRGGRSSGGDGWRGAVRGSGSVRGEQIAGGLPALDTDPSAAGEGRGTSAVYPLAGLGVLAGALAGGFFFYRRRLP